MNAPLDRAQLNALITDNIDANGVGAITGTVLQQVLLSILTSTESIYGDVGAGVALGITRAQIASLVIPVTSFTVAGFATNGDDGAGATYVRGTSGGLLAIEDASGQWWNLLNTGVLYWGWFGAKGDGTTDDHAAINACHAALNATGGGVARMNAKTYLVAAAVVVTGMSNIIIMGLGVDIGSLKCTAAFNGSSNTTASSVISALNFGATAPYPFKNICIYDLTIDCTLQNVAMNPTSGGGFNACGIELQNVDFARVERCKIIKAFGNGVVIGSLSPLQAQSVQYGVVNACIFDTCVRGVLPQYQSSSAPAGITGNCIQIGAGIYCSITNNRFINPGGDAIEMDVYWYGFCQNNTMEGLGSTPIGSCPNNTSNYVQGSGNIASGGGLKGTIISGNRFIGSGGIYLLGDIGGSYSSGAEPQPGPLGCTIADNYIYQSYGPTLYPGGVPAIFASGGSWTNPNSQPVIIYLSGATGYAATVKRNPSGSVVAQALGPSNGVGVQPGDTFSATWTGTSTWNILLAPNLNRPGIFIDGGSTVSVAGQAQFNTITGNKVILPGKQAILLIDASNNTVSGNTLQDICQTSVLTGAGSDYVAVSLQTSTNLAGAGCQNNDIKGNFIVEDRSPAFLAYSYQDDAPGGVARCTENNFSQNYLPAVTAVSISSNSPNNFFNDNRGPGATGAALGWVSIRQLRSALEAAGNLTTVNTDIGATITTAAYIAWNNSDRAYFNTADPLYIAIKAALTFTDAQMATLYLAAVALTQ